jgi:hypothetical protein
VGIVGLGGGGSHVVQQLAHIGIGRFVLVDPDTISLTNLNRLVGGTLADVEANLPKIEIAERIIRSLNQDAGISKHQCHWQEALEALKDCDVIIGGLDSVRAKDELDAFTRRFLIPYIDMGMDVHETSPSSYLVAGQVVLTGPGQPCLRCLGVVTDDALLQEAKNYGAAGGKPQVVWPNGALASGAVGLLMQLVTPWNENPIESAFLEYDGNLHTLVNGHRHKRMLGKACNHHGQSELGDPFFDIRHTRESKTPTTMLPPKGLVTSTNSSSSKRSWWARLFSGSVI